MRFTLSLVCLLSVAAPMSAQSTINLLSLEEVRNTGSYSYYARGDIARKNIPPFTKFFYPGGGALKPEGLHASSGGGGLARDGQLTDEGDNALPVPFISGELTDRVLDGTKGGAPIVSGWINTLSRGEVSEAGANTGQFDILFDLGSIYQVTKVVVYARDQGGHRWTSEQECFTAESFANPAQPVDNDFRFFATATFPSDKTMKVDFTGASRSARYVNLRLATSVSRRAGPTASMGGILYEVEIYGRR